MAWEKVGVNRWRNKDTIIEIFTNLYSSSANGGWEVIVKNERTGYYYDDKLLKSKLQALKFAKYYMRTH